MAAGYGLTDPGITIGSPMLDGELANDARVQVALSMMNRHGLIAGATGTGTTKTRQLLAGELSILGRWLAERRLGTRRASALACGPPRRLPLCDDPRRSQTGSLRDSATR